MPHSETVQQVSGFVGRLRKPALKATDAACDFIVQNLPESADPRTRALIETLQAACRARQATRRR